MSTNKTYKYSEIFGRTFQGEGTFTGVPTVWIRFWGCNFECKGFPGTGVVEQSIDPRTITRLEDLPVITSGCDSGYSWSTQYAHLAKRATASEICDQFTELLKSPSNPTGLFTHPVSNQRTHLAFTGGEPMLNQTAIADILTVLNSRRALHTPRVQYTIETNGTIPLRDRLIGVVEDINSEVFWSVSPKLSLSGESWSDAVKPSVVKQYAELTSMINHNNGQLKYVSDGSDQSWEEIHRATEEYRAAGVTFPVWVMPVGADVAGQDMRAARIAEGCFERGYNFCARVHTYVFGNCVGK